jgi:glycerate kinase
MKSGIDTVCSCPTRQEAEGVDVVISGEGRRITSPPTARSSTAWERAQKARHPRRGHRGSMLPRAESLYDCGITSIIPTVNGIMPLRTP